MSAKFAYELAAGVVAFLIVAWLCVAAIKAGVV